MSELAVLCSRSHIPKPYLVDISLCSRKRIRGRANKFLRLKSMKDLPGTSNQFGLFLLFLICGVSLPSLSGLLVFPFSIIPPSFDFMYRVGLSITFFLFTLVSYKKQSLKKYWKILFSFFIASFAINLQVMSGFLSPQPSPINTIVLSMVLSTVLVVVPIIVLTLISGEDRTSLFLEKGNIKLGLVAGLAGFFIFAAGSIPEATYLFQGQDLTLDKAFAWAPWILVTVMANGLREELLYRGLFLKKYGPLLGPHYSNLLQAIIFSLSHTIAGRGTITYTPYTFALVLFTFLLGLLWGSLMQRTNSILGSVLFHAGTDIAVFLGIFSNLL